MEATNSLSFWIRSEPFDRAVEEVVYFITKKFYQLNSKHIFAPCES